MPRPLKSAPASVPQAVPPPVGAARPHLFLVDGSGYIFRAFHALPPMTRPDGTPVNAVYGFTAMLMKLLRDMHAEYVAVIFDAGRLSFRNDIYKEYKAHRPEPPPELVPQFALVRDATRACNVACIEMPGFEADDLIATYAHQAASKGVQVTIVSSDKDLMQLIGDGITMRDPIKDRMIGPAEVVEKFGVGPDRVVDVQALIGDSTDNVPGVPGIGPTAASACITKFGSLAAVLEAAKNPETFAAAFRAEADALEQEICKALPRACKLGRTSKDLAAILFDEMKIPGGTKDAKGFWDVGNDALEALTAKGPKVIGQILVWREKSRAAGAAAGWAEKINKNRSLAEISLRLVQLKTDLALPAPYEEFSVKEPEPAVLQAFLKLQGFSSLLARYNLAGESVGTPSAPAPKQMPNPAPAAPATAEAAPVRELATLVTARNEPPAKVETSYELVQDVARLEDWIARATTAGAVAVDTETTSLDAVRAELVGVSLALEDGRACYVPLAHRAPGSQAGGDGGLDLAGTGRKEAPRQIPMADALQRLKPLLEDAAVLKVGHNIKYDCIVLSDYGITVAPVDDSMLLSYVLDGGKNGHGMDELAQLHLGHTTIKFTDVAGSGKSQVGFDCVELGPACDYAAEDADITGRLHRLLRRRLVGERMVTVYETIERPLIPVIGAMERAGIRVDRHALAEMSRDFSERLRDIENDIHKLAGHPFNIGSPKQLGEVLFDELRLRGGKKGKTGAYATGADVLEELAVDHPLPQHVLDWRQLAKLKSTYADALVDQINPKTGRVHTSYAMAVASTGRLSSTDPNLQNIPVRTEEGRKIRRAFVAEAGHKLLSVDYSQIELRLVADIGNIDALKQAFRDGVDIHALTASQVFGVPLTQMDAQTRRKAKAINFGIIYGISGFGLSRQLGCTPREAAEYIKAYFDRYPGIRDYMERAKKDARARGYVTTLFGRRCHVPGINDKNPARRGFAERQAINAPIQGTAADIIKRAMIRVPPALAGAGLKARMLLQVHDELLFEVPEDEVDRTSALVRQVMERACEPALKLGVPLVADAGAGSNWAEAH